MTIRPHKPVMQAQSTLLQLPSPPSERLDLSSTFHDGLGNLGRLPDHLIVSCVLAEVAEDRLSLVNFAAVSKKSEQLAQEAAYLLIKSYVKDKAGPKFKNAVFYRTLSPATDRSIQANRLRHAQYYLQRGEAANAFESARKLQNEGKWGHAAMTLKSLFMGTAHATSLGVKHAYMSAANAEVLGTQMLEMQKHFEFVLTHKALATPDMICHAKAFVSLAEGRSRKAERKKHLLTACGEALKIWPDYAQAHFYLGSVRRTQGKFLLAERSLRKALLLQSEFQECRLELGRVLIGQGRLEDARHVAADLAAFRNGPAKQQQLLAWIAKSDPAA